MEHTLGSWVAPLLLVPGMALLVISTANRYAQLLSRLLDQPGDPALCRQLRLLRFALMSLYSGISMLALAGLLGGLLDTETELARLLMLLLSCAGVLCLFFASLLLIRDVSQDPLQS